MHERIILKGILKMGNVKLLAGFSLLRIVPLGEYYIYKTSDICNQCASQYEKYDNTIDVSYIKYYILFGISSWKLDPGMDY
jgi:hypothetical protein